MVSEANFAKERIELLILASPISLHCKNFSIEHPFYKNLKFLEFFKHLRFILQEINPGKFTKTINKTDIIFFLPTDSGAEPQT
jgi:hypothetical protein